MTQIRCITLFCFLLFSSVPAPTQNSSTPSLAKPELALQLGHNYMVVDVAFSPDGKTLATVSESVKLWDVESGTLLRTLETRGGASCVAWSPDSRRVVAAGHLLLEAGRLWFWDARSGELLRMRDEPKQNARKNIQCIAFSPDGSTLATGGTDGSIKLRDPQTGEVRSTLGTHDDWVNEIAFAPDGSTLVSAGQDNFLKVWDIPGGKEKRAWKTFENKTHGGLYALAISHDGRSLAAGGGDNVIRLWDLHSGQLKREMNGHEQPVSSISFSPDGGTLISAGGDNTFKTWSLQSGTVMRSVNKPSPSSGVVVKDTVIAVSGHANTSAYLTIPNVVAFSPDGRWIAQGNYDFSVTLLNATDPKRARIFRGQENSWGVAIAPDGRTIASTSSGHYGNAADSGNTVRLWDAQTGALLRTFNGHTGPVWRVEFSPDGKTLLSGAWDKSARLWDVESGALLKSFETQNRLVSHVAFSPDGNTVAAASAAVPQGSLEVWKVEDGSRLRAISIGDCYDIAFAPHRPEIAAAIYHRSQKRSEVLIWDVQSGALQKTLVAPNGFLQSITYSPDGKVLAGGGGDHSNVENSTRAASGLVLLWDAQSGEVRHTFNGHEQSVMAVAFNPDGKTLASGATDRTIRLWDVASGQLQRTLIGHQSWVAGLDFSTDNRRLVSVGRDSTLRVWQPQSGRLLATLLTLPEVADTTLAARPLEIGAKAIEIGAKAAEMAGKEWFAVTPEGYFDCSTNAAKFIKWRVGESLFPAERYYRKFRRPDLVQASLRGEKIDAPQMTSEDIPPSAQFVSLKYSGAEKEKQNEVLVTLEVRSNREIKEVLLLANGRPLPPESEKPIQVSIAPANLPARPIDIGAKAIEIGAKAIEIGAKAIEIGGKAGSASTPPGRANYQIAKRYIFRAPLPLGAREITLRAVAYDAGELGSNPTQISLNNSAAKAVPGRLFALCIGLSNYKQGKLGTLATPKKGEVTNLKYPAIDAKSLAERLQKEGAPLYEKVEIKTLVNEQATLPNIRAALKWLQTSVRPGQIDTAVLCLSGHGLSDGQGRYFFPTYEFDPKSYEISLSGEELQRELGGKLRAKSVFLFVDTCHSGALAGSRSDDLNFQVNASGVYMMASSAATQYSYESKEWGHGAFTYALLRSLAKKELSRNGIIHFNVLTYAVPDEIAKLLKAAGQSEDAMAPVVPLEGRFLDAPVAGAR